MYICDSCGTLKETLRIVKECRGEFWGRPCYEVYADRRCSCGGWYRPAKICPVCKRFFPQGKGCECLKAE